MQYAFSCNHGNQSLGKRRTDKVLHFHLPLYTWLPVWGLQLRGAELPLLGREALVPAALLLVLLQDRTQQNRHHKHKLQLQVIRTFGIKAPNEFCYKHNWLVGLLSLHKLKSEIWESVPGLG